MKNTYTFLAPCHFGLESVLKRELQDLGLEISLVEDGRVTFQGEIQALCRANIFFENCRAGASAGGKVSGGKL